MKLVYRLMLLFFLPSALSFAQVQPEWVRFFNNENNTDDGGISIAMDLNRNQIVIGTAQDKMIVMKYSPDGNLLWERRQYNVSGHGVEVDSEGNIYALGWSGGASCFIVKYSSEGTMVWNLSYSNPNSTFTTKDIEVDPFGNVFVFFALNGCSLVKFNSSGVFQWNKRYLGTGGITTFTNFNRSLKLDQIGNLYVTFTANNGPTGQDIVTIKYNNSGDSLWTRSYNRSGDSFEDGECIDLDESSNVYVTGKTVENSIYYTVLVKYSNIGNIQWSRVFEGGYEAGIDIKCKNNGVYVAGGFVGANQQYSPTAKFDYNGNHIWTAYYSEPGVPNFTSKFIEVDVTGNLYVGGYIRYSSQNYDIAAIKFNNLGSKIWTLQYDRGQNLFDQPKGMTIDNNKLVFTGISALPVSGYDIITMKYNSDPIGIISNTNIVPNTFFVSQNFPNPFNPSTTIKFGIPSEDNDKNIRIVVYNLTGQIQKVLMDQQLKSGSYTISYDASALSSGIYFCRVLSGKNSITRKMLLLK